MLTCFSVKVYTKVFFFFFLNIWTECLLILYVFTYVATFSCEAWNFIPLYVSTNSLMTIKLTWICALFVLAKSSHIYLHSVWYNKSCFKAASRQLHINTKENNENNVAQFNSVSQMDNTTKFISSLNAASVVYAIAKFFPGVTSDLSLYKLHASKRCANAINSQISLLQEVFS